MNKKERKISVTDILLIAVSAVTVIGINTWFKTCGPMEDGSYMACHWAGQAVKGISVLVLLLSIVHMLLSDRRVKAGLSIGISGAAVLMIIMPGGLIRLCQMAEMACRSRTQPWTIALGVLLLIVSIADAFINLSRSSEEKHRRNR